MLKVIQSMRKSSLSRSLPLQIEEHDRNVQQGTEINARNFDHKKSEH